jgi:histidinol-phosphatase
VSAPPVDREPLELAVSVARGAGACAAERFFAADFATRTKPDGTDVTDVDLAVEDLIRTELLRHTPDDEIYGEEAGSLAGTSGRRWVIDPIDGTAYFANRIPLFTNLIAYEDEHGPAIGVINHPVAQRLVFAGRGLGCWVRTGTGAGAGDAADRRAVLGGQTGLRETCTQLANPATWHAGLLAILHQNVWITGYLGGVTGVVTGMLDAVVMAGFPQGYEDLAPLPVIVEEAGGRVTDLSGGPLLSGPGTALVSTGHRHDDLLRLVAGLPHGPAGKLVDGRWIALVQD